MGLLTGTVNPRSYRRTCLHLGDHIRMRGYLAHTNPEVISRVEALADEAGIPHQRLWLRHQRTYLLMVAEGYEDYLRQ